MKKPKKLILRSETLHHLTLAHVHGGQSVKDTSDTKAYCDSNVPYDCPSVAGGCTFTVNTGSGTATQFCVPA